MSGKLIQCFAVLFKYTYEYGIYWVIYINRQNNYKNEHELVKSIDVNLLITLILKVIFFMYQK